LLTTRGARGRDEDKRSASGREAENGHGPIAKPTARGSTEKETEVIFEQEGREERGGGQGA